MNVSLKFASVLTCGLLLAGCGKSEQPTAQAPAPAGATTPQSTVTGAVDNANKVVTGAGTQAAGAANTATENAKAKVTEIAQDISQKNFTAADAAMKDLEGMKGSLSESMQMEITALRTKLDAAKAANGAAGNMPKMPGM